MARILICHTADDAAAASGLGAALANRGFTVSLAHDAAIDRDRLSDLYIFDGVVVVWSAASIGSAKLHDVAREALFVNRLVAVQAGDLAVEQVPTEFRKLGALRIGDVDGIARILDRLRRPDPPSAPRRVGAAEPPDVGAAEPRGRPLDIGLGYESGRRRDFEGIGAAADPPRFPSMPRGVGSGSTANPVRTIEGVGAADVPRRSAYAASAPQDKALAVEAGRLVHKIPQQMWVGEHETVEVRLGRAEAEGLTQGLVGRGALSSSDIPILETMSISLYARGGAFDIERQSETTQLVSGGDQLKGTPFEQADYGRWIWLVTPRKSGAHMLFVKVTASLKDSRGLPTSASLPDREFPVSVSVHAGKTTMLILRRGLLGIGGAVGAALLGAVTQELWWPKLKLMLQGWGWLG